MKLRLLLGIAISVLFVGCEPAKTDSTKTEPAKNSGASTATDSSPAKATEKGSAIRVDGSSTVFPVSEAIAEDFHNSTQKDVTVGTSGTGGGFKKFYRGETDVSNASRPITKEEIEKCKEAGIEYIELPICFDALTVVVNKENNWVDTITVEELKKMWEPGAQDTVKTWNQVRADWPSDSLALFGAGSDSGTFDYFTEAICGKAKASRGDYTASEDDNTLVQGVTGNKHSLGYVPYSYYAENQDKLKALAIDWEKDQVGGILPSEEAVLKGEYNPLSRPLFVYINKKSLDSRPEVKEYAEYLLNNIERLAKETNFVPLPAAAYDLCKKRLAEGKTGTLFGGEAAVGMKIDELLSKESAAQ